MPWVAPYAVFPAVEIPNLAAHAVEDVEPGLDDTETEHLHQQQEHRPPGHRQKISKVDKLCRGDSAWRGKEIAISGVWKGASLPRLGGGKPPPAHKS